MFVHVYVCVYVCVCVGEFSSFQKYITKKTLIKECPVMTTHEITHEPQSRVVSLKVFKSVLSNSHGYFGFRTYFDSDYSIKTLGPDITSGLMIQFSECL